MEEPAAHPPLVRRLPGLIVLDLMMPDMNGFELLAELRARLAWHDVPVVVVTAKDPTLEDRRRLDGQVERILAKGLSVGEPNYKVRVVQRLE